MRNLLCLFLVLSVAAEEWVDRQASYHIWIPAGSIQKLPPDTSEDSPIRFYRWLSSPALSVQIAQFRNETPPLSAQTATERMFKGSEQNILPREDRLVKGRELKDARSREVYRCAYLEENDTQMVFREVTAYLRNDRIYFLIFTGRPEDRSALRSLMDQIRKSFRPFVVSGK